jgi:cytochrome c-type protein NapB
MRSIARFVLHAALAMLLAVTLLAIAAIAAPAATETPAASPAATPEAPVKLQSLRGDTPINKTTEPDMFKLERDRPPIPRSSTSEPPLIPHSIRGYQITKNFNQCMDCHAWSKVKETGATKVSVTHFKDSTGRELANISPRRYVCTTCHVPQTDAKPLVGNTFRPAVEFVPKK